MQPTVRCIKGIPSGPFCTLGIRAMLCRLPWQRPENLFGSYIILQWGTPPIEISHAQ